MEASALQARIGLAQRISIGAPLLRLRSDEQLVELFRAGHEEAFHVIHDRYRQRLFAYTRQMLPGCRQDAEDALQDIFVRAYSGLRASDRQLALRAWLYRVAHNRCIDELRRPAPPPPEVLQFVRAPIHDPTAAAEQRESLQRLIADVRRLPEQQRSALLMRELAGMTYADVASALGVSVPAVKSLLVRARVGLAEAIEARDIACSEIREELIVAHDRGVRSSGMVRRHLRDCDECRHFRRQVRGASRQFAALAPALGPLGILAKFGLGGGAGSGAAAGGSAAVGGGAAGTGGAAASIGILATGAGHVAPLLAAAVVAAGGAVELQHTVTQASHRRVHDHAKAAVTSVPAVAPAVDPSPSSIAASTSYATTTLSSDPPAAASTPPPASEQPAPAQPRPATDRRSATRRPATGAGGWYGSPSKALITGTTDPSNSSTVVTTASATGGSGSGTDSSAVTAGMNGSVPTGSPPASSSSTASTTGAWTSPPTAPVPAAASTTGTPVATFASTSTGSTSLSSTGADGGSSGPTG